MKNAIMVGFALALFNSSAMAYGYFYDQVDAMADRDIAEINAQERAEIMHELRENDFYEAQQIMQQDEALKREIRREEAVYDSARDRQVFYEYGDYDW